MKGLLLIGQKASGKSTQAQRLAALLGCRWIDSDRQMVQEQQAGSIERLYASDPDFRSQELQLVQRLSIEPQLVATGAGLISTIQGREFLAHYPYLVFWDVEPAICWQRIAASGKGYLGNYGLEQWQAVFQQREEWYRQVGAQRACTQQQLDRIAARWWQLVGEVR